MTSLARASVLASLVSLVALSSTACSAVVAPDTHRLGPGQDGGPGSWDGGSLDRVDGAAPCPTTLVACGARCVDLSSDPLSCGRCDRACGPGESCVSGTCACAPGDPRCGGLTDPASCGPSRTRCGGGQLCVGGACVCRPPLTLVGGACVDLATDASNCGVPGTSCGGDVCAAGRCIPRCPDATRECDGACVDTRRDPLNCGDCGQRCNGTEACQDGNCRDVQIAAGCTSCPCDACRGLQCCTLPVFEVPYCLEADRCP